MSETAIYRVQHLLGASLTLRNYNEKVGGDIRHDQSTQQANRDKYARNSTISFKMQTIYLVLALKLNSATKPLILYIMIMRGAISKNSTHTPHRNY